MRIFLSLVALVLVFNTITAQQERNLTVWADTVIEFSSQRTTKEYGANQVLGPPNSLPQGGNSAVAWSPAQKSAKEYILVGFEKVFKATKVIVAENEAISALSEVIVCDSMGKEYPIFFQKVSKSERKPGLRFFPIPEGTPKPFKVKLVLNPKAAGVLSQIDAIGLTDIAAPFEIEVQGVPKDVFLFKPEPLGEEINSKAEEINPVVSVDGKTLYFVRYKHAENIGRTKLEDIWYATRLDTLGKRFSKSINPGKPLNNESINAVASVSPEGSRLLVMNEYMPDGKLRKGISLSHHLDTGWSTPEPMKIMDFYNDSPENEFCMSVSGKFLILSLNRKEGLGERDLYICHRMGELLWSSPKNLGKQINTAGDEASPFLAADQQTLYFSSDGYPGYGGHDIYITRKLDTSWTHWSSPVNLGATINGNDWDAYYTVAALGDYAYMVSNNGANGSDIFRVQLPKEISPEPFVPIAGKLVDEDNKPIKADVIYQDLPTGEELGSVSSDANSGDFLVLLPYGKDYSIHAEATGYISESVDIKLKDTVSLNSVEIDIPVLPIQVGTHIRLNHVYFDLGLATLKKESYPELDRVVTFLQDNKRVEIEVGGHTDDSGSPTVNMTLSEARAKAIVNYMLKKGIDTKRLTYKGYGETQPLESNKSASGRKTNRRVEFIIKRD